MSLKLFREYIESIKENQLGIPLDLIGANSMQSARGIVFCHVFELSAGFFYCIEN